VNVTILTEYHHIEKEFATRAFKPNFLQELRQLKSDAAYVGLGPAVWDGVPV
jgi:hypothetical protein